MVTIRYSSLYNRSVINPTSIRFKTNALKGLLTRFGEQRYSYKVKWLYRLSFRRLAQMGVINIVHSTLLWSQIANKRPPQIWGKPISLQNEIP